MIHEELMRRRLPDALTFLDGTPVTGITRWPDRRREILDTVCRLQYGFPPASPDSVSFQVEETNHDFCVSKATLERIRVTVSLPQGAFSFPFRLMTPNTGNPCRTFVHVSFHDAVPNEFMPAEEICDNGFAVASLFYGDVTSDDGDFSNGLAALVPGSGADGEARTPDAPGKIALWAWAAMRVADVLVSRPDRYEAGSLAIIGHSRLGKTALFAGVLDERFRFIFANNSGCSGTSLYRGKTGETATRIGKTFPYWFCRNFSRYADHEEEMPFDQHQVMALAVPRHVYACCAAGDAWADPVSEYLACAAVSEVYALDGGSGFRHPDRLPVPGEVFAEGRVGYHLREGSHYLSRTDWQRCMAYVKAHA